MNYSSAPTVFARSVIREIFMLWRGKLCSGRFDEL
jgi:hypothetical protein